MALPKFNVTPDAIKKGVQTAQQMFGTSGVSAAKASTGAGTQTTGSVPQSTPVAGSQASHQAWINNAASGQGGMDAYTARQNERYAQAMQSNNTDEISKLIADSQRVGYGLSYDAVKNTPAPVQPMGGMPQNDPVYNTQTGSQLNQYAQDQTALDRAALLNSSNTLMNSLKNNAEYSNKLIQDNRVLEDFFANQRTNPFSGGADYRAAMTARGRSIDDSARGSELSNRLNAISTELADFDRLTPERQRAIYNELLQLERNFAINQAGVTGNYGGQRTLAGSAQDWGQQMDLTDRLGYFPNAGSASGGNNSAALNSLSSLAGARTMDGQRLDQDIKQSNWNAYMDMVNQTGNLGQGPQSNWGNLVGQAGSGQNTLTGDQQQFNQGVTMAELTGYLPNGQQTSREQQTQLENLWNVAKQTGRIPDTLADIYGLQRGSSTLDAQEFALSQARESRIASGGSGGGGGSRSSGSGSGSSQEGPSPVKATASEMNSMYDNLLSQYGTLNQSTNKYSAPTSQQGKQNIILRILDFNLPDDQTENLLRRFNMTVAEADKILNTPAPKQPELPTSGQLLRDTIKF